MEKTVNHDKQMPKAPGLRLRTAGRQRADAVQRHRRNVEAFHLLKIQRIKGIEQRRLQFSLHTSLRFFPPAVGDCQRGHKQAVLRQMHR